MNAMMNAMTVQPHAHQVETVFTGSTLPESPNDPSRIVQIFSPNLKNSISGKIQSAVFLKSKPENILPKSYCQKLKIYSPTVFYSQNRKKFY